MNRSASLEQSCPRNPTGDDHLARQKPENGVVKAILDRIGAILKSVGLEAREPPMAAARSSLQVEAVIRDRSDRPAPAEPTPWAEASAANSRGDQGQSRVKSGSLFSSNALLPPRFQVYFYAADSRFSRMILG